MKGSTIVAALAAATLLAAGAASAGDRDRGRGGPDWDGHGWGGHGGGAMLDFDAVAEAGTEALDRGQLVSWGVEQLGALDTDGNGTLSRQELAAAMPDMPENPLMVFAPDPTELRVDRFLAMFDAGTAGEVQVETVVARQVDRLFRRLDRDDDGSISRAEAETASERRGRDRDRRRRD